MLIILLVLHVFVKTHSLWPLLLTCTEAPKPHVNSDNGGLGDSGNCCLSVQWNERLSCNGPPVGSVCKLLCAAAVVWGLPSELHISVLFWLAASFGWEQFIWRLSLLVKVIQCFCCIKWLKWGSNISKETSSLLLRVCSPSKVVILIKIFL